MQIFKNYTIMNNKKEKIYISPEMEIVFVEVEQSIMSVSSVSTERLGTWHEEQEW